MRNLLFLICICVVTSCTSQYEFEDKIYSCTKKNYHSAGINSDELVEELDTYFQEKKYLKNTSAESYVQLIESILSPNQFQISFPQKLEKKLTVVPMMNQNCAEINLDSAELNESRFFEIMQDISKSYQRISTTGDLDMENFFKNLLPFFKKEDFEHPLFKIIFYHIVFSHSSVNNQSNEDKGVLTQLPPWSKDQPDITKLKERNVFKVLVNSKNEIFLKGKKINLKDLRSKTKEFINNPKDNPELAERPTKAIISLQNDRGTKYDVYIKVLNELKAAYNELRNEKAMELYNLPYQDLEKTQQKEIRNMFPLIISESEPTAFGEEN